MGQDLCAHSQAARQVFDEADQYLGTKLSTICFYGPEESLRQTVNTQPALFVTSVAAFKALQEAGAPMPQAVAGHSVGEYAALVAAGALDLETGLHLVSRRAQAMHRATLTEPGAMAAVLGLSAADVVAACQEAGAEQVQAANFNGGGQVVISGTPAGVERAGEIARAKGAKRIVALNVSGAFHSRLMETAVHAMGITLADAAIRDAAIPVVANLTANYETSAAEIKANLAAQIDHPVRWEESIERLAQDGYNAFVEVGSSTVLAGLMKRIVPGATIYSVGDSAGVAAFGSAQGQN